MILFIKESILKKRASFAENIKPSYVVFPLSPFPTMTPSPASILRSFCGMVLQEYQLCVKIPPTFEQMCKGSKDRQVCK